MSRASGRPSGPGLFQCGYGMISDEKNVFLVANLEAGGAYSSANVGDSGMIHIFN